jgi:chromosome segregation and condensation protein ScpB
MAIRTLGDAAAWVDRVGLALVFPKDDVVLPSLWAAAGGTDEYAERDDSGTFLRWTPPMEFVWTTKDELPAQRLCAAGKHLRGRASLVAVDVLPALVALAPREDPVELEGEVVAVLREQGPLSTRELPELLPHHERKRVRGALDRLQKSLVVTNAGLEETDGWPAIVVDLVERRFADRLRDLPSPEDARALLAERLLAVARELTAEDLRGAFGWRKADAREALEKLDVEAREEEGFTVFVRPR